MNTGLADMKGCKIYAGQNIAIDMNILFKDVMAVVWMCWLMVLIFKLNLSISLHLDWLAQKETH